MPQSSLSKSAVGKALADPNIMFERVEPMVVDGRTVDKGKATAVSGEANQSTIPTI